MPGVIRPLRSFANRHKPLTGYSSFFCLSMNWYLSIASGEDLRRLFKISFSKLDNRFLVNSFFDLISPFADKISFFPAYEWYFFVTVPWGSTTTARQIFLNCFFLNSYRIFSSLILQGFLLGQKPSQRRRLRGTAKFSIKVCVNRFYRW